MGRYIATRLLQGLGVVLAVYTLIFAILHSSGDPLSLLVPEEFTAAMRAVVRADLGLDRPLWVQYFTNLGGILRGDFGTSFYFHEPAVKLVIERIPATAELVLATMVIALGVAIPVGVLAATRRGTWLDSLIRTGTLVGISAPPFLVALLLILLFTVQLQVLPASGRGRLSQLILPAGSLALYRLALLVRLVRSGMLEVMGLDYIRTARAKGLSLRVVLYRHALRNTLIPVVTMVGLEMGALLTGAIITERIFAWPGMGWLIVEALNRLDYPVVTAYAFFTACMFVIVNLAVDLTYLALDPKVRYT